MEKLRTDKPGMNAKPSRNAAPSGKQGSHHKPTDSKPASNTPSAKALGALQKRTERVSAMPIGRRDK